MPPPMSGVGVMFSGLTTHLSVQGFVSEISQERVAECL